MRADYDVIIIGTGFAGIGMAIRLKEAGIHNFVILEKDDGVGGTWRANQYPGAACDVQSHLYSFSFEPNPSWTRMFAPQGEILRYLEHCADKYGLKPHLRFHSEVKTGRFDEDSGLWRVTLQAGETLSARFVVTGTGGLSKPSYPDIKGLASFAGTVFHTARWQHDYDLRAKRVAVIGTGASAIQVVPAIVERVAKLKLFQRTPPWVMPKPDREIGPRERSLYARYPRLQRMQRKRLYWTLEARAVGFVVAPKIMTLVEQQGRDYLKERVKDPVLRRKLTPRYRIGCKRVLISNDYFEAVQHPNAELVTEGISEVRAHSVLTNDGREHEVDAIILATGFQAAEAVAPFELKGKGGLDLNEHWRAGAEAYLGNTVAGFPNLFMIVGPNTGLGHSSMVFMIESQVQYTLEAIKLARAQKLQSIEVRREVQDHFNRDLQARMATTIWATGGCTSWYVTASGKNTTLWPGFTYDFRRRTQRFDAENYTLVGSAEARVVLEANISSGKVVTAALT
jgi:cation diffusion facilitator CzcD-associated flavoprotein CzcO